MKYYKEPTSNKFYKIPKEGNTKEISLKGPYLYGESFITLDWIENTPHSKHYVKSSENEWNQAKEKLIRVILEG